MKRAVILLLVISLWFGGSGFAKDCRKLAPKVKQASQFVLGIEFPWWYNLGQIETESNCMWRTSLDGWGSIGYGQITPKFWDSVLGKMFPEWKVRDSLDHFLAQAYIVKECIRQAKCKKLWNAYQCYNRSCGKVNKEAELGGCVWEMAYDVCKERFAERICVWKVGSECRQYRTNCEINYEYGYKVWKHGRKYREVFDEKRFAYW